MNENITLPNGVIVNIQASTEGAVILTFTGAKYADLESYTRDPEGSTGPQLVLSVPAAG